LDYCPSWKLLLRYKFTIARVINEIQTNPPTKLSKADLALYAAPMDNP